MEHETETKLASSNSTIVRSSGSSCSTSIAIASGMGEVGGGNRLRDWQHSSRIIRVSRASGGKDRHSKVWTAKGPRDRRVRLSVATAIQFYDLQDRLGVDQPSKAVEWLIKAASDAISELPSLNSSFDPERETPRQLQISDGNGHSNANGDDEQVFDSSAELDQCDPGFVQTKSSACSSSPSETSKGSRSEIRVKARERARERTAKDKDRDKPEESTQQQQQQQQMTQSSSSSFTQLLTSGIGNITNPGVNTSSSMNNYIMGASPSARGAQIIQLGNHHHPGMHHHHQQAVMSVSPFGVGGDHELQHFPFVHDHHLIVPASTGGGGGSSSGGDHSYNLNFSISPSSALAAYNNTNRGTLQSNSLPSLMPHFQRFSSSPMDGSTLPFFLAAPVENPHQHQHQQHHNAGQFPSGLQLCYGDNGGGASDHKGKGKN